MTSAWRDRPAALLTRHFFEGLFDLRHPLAEGADSFVRVLIGLFAVFSIARARARPHCM